MIARFLHRCLRAIYLSVAVLPLFFACIQPDNTVSGKSHSTAEKGTLTLSLSLKTGGGASMARTIAPRPGVADYFMVEIKDGGTIIISKKAAAVRNTVTNTQEADVKLEVTRLKDGLTLTVTAFNTNNVLLASGSRILSAADLLRQNASIKLELANTLDGKSKIELSVQVPHNDATKNISNFTAELCKISNNSRIAGPTSFALTQVPGSYNAKITFNDIPVEPLFLIMRFYRSPNNTLAAVFLESVIVYQGFVSNQWIDHRQNTPDFQDTLIFDEKDFRSAETGIKIALDGVPLSFDNAQTAYFDKNKLSAGVPFKISITPETGGSSFRAFMGSSDITGNFVRDTTVTHERVYIYQSQSYNPAVDFIAQSNLQITVSAENGTANTIYYMMPADFHRKAGMKDYYYPTLQAAADAVLTGTANIEITALQNEITLYSTAVLTNKGSVTLTTNAGANVSLKRGTGITSTLIVVQGATEFTLKAAGGAAALTIDGGGINASGPLIQINNGGKFILNERVTLTNNNNAGGSGGALSVTGNGSTVTMDGGRISGNTARHGGGVYLSDSGASMTMNGGLISGNTAATGGGGVYLTSYASFSIINPTNAHYVSGNISNSSFANVWNNGGTLYINNAAAASY